ncbi:DUF6406 domain-containing protein [Streptomyces sp. NBC_01314]|uniref:DUF6406 domain-containing protein n=1 Tax=Streptomyces sp. NBC_01314 TaxID=2903821 RepID=UPI00308AAED9|nr:hypothetical protein OG622_20285 [Streptomyces sp. NBC_01314]
MTVSQICLTAGIQRNTDIGSFGVIYVDARAETPLTVRLVVSGAEENRYNLHLGDTFPVGEDTWYLDRVEDPTGDWAVFLSQAEQGEPATTP